MEEKLKHTHGLVIQCRKYKNQLAIEKVYDNIDKNTHESLMIAEHFLNLDKESKKKIFRNSSKESILKYYEKTQFDFKKCVRYFKTDEIIPKFGNLNDELQIILRNLLINYNKYGQSIPKRKFEKFISILDVKGRTIVYYELEEYHELYLLYKQYMFKLIKPRTTEMKNITTVITQEAAKHNDTELLKELKPLYNEYEAMRFHYYLLCDDVESVKKMVIEKNIENLHIYSRMGEQKFFNRTFTDAMLYGSYDVAKYIHSELEIKISDHIITYVIKNQKESYESFIKPMKFLIEELGVNFENPFMELIGYKTYFDKKDQEKYIKAFRYLKSKGYTYHLKLLEKLVEINNNYKIKYLLGEVIESGDIPKNELDTISFKD